MQMASEIVQICSGCLFTHRFHLPDLQGSYLGKSAFWKCLCLANTDSGLALPGALCSVMLAIHGGLSELLIGSSIETISQMESGVDTDGNLISSGHQGSGAIQTCKFSTEGLVFSGTLRRRWHSTGEDELS